MKAPISFPVDELRLGAQIRDAWRQVDSLKLDRRYALHDTRYASVVVSGMGGSTLGAHVIQTAYRNELTIPFEISNDYSLPNYVGRDSLVILSSYSGMTEETLASAREAIKRKARIVVMTNGGELLNLAKKHKLPCYQIDASENPSNQPRMAIGYMTIGIAGILSKAGVLKITEREIKTLAAAVDKQDPALGSNLASHISQSAILLVSAEHLAGAIHVFNNQINENAKQISIAQCIPEIDHHFMEGIIYPRKIKKHLSAVLFQSNRYHPRNQMRIKLTADLFQRNGIRPITVDINGKNLPEEAWTAIALGASCSLALAKSHKIDPWPIPNVDWLKQQMKRV